MKKLARMIVLSSVVLMVSSVSGATASVVPEELWRCYVERDYVKAEALLDSALAAATSADAKFVLNVELGDLYLDKLADPAKAAAVYNSIVSQNPDAKNIADIYYRIAVCDELLEKYLDAAQGYEKVAIKYQGSTYAEDALNAIERCFRKNYQDRAAYVDGYPITRLEFDDRVSQAPAQYEKFPEKLKLLNSMIDDRLLLVAARAAGLPKDPAFVKEMNGYRRDEMMQTWYDGEVVKKVVIDDSMKRNYYRDHKNDYITPEQVRAREIQVKEKELADSLYHRITVEKVAFESLAHQYSVAPSKDRGGDMGYFRKGSRAKEIEDVAFAMKPGEVSKPVKTADGYVLLKLEERRDRKERTYDDVKNEIENRLKPTKTQERFTRLLDDMKRLRVSEDTLAIAQDKDVLAVVDGTPVTKADMALAMERIPPMYRAQFETPEGKKRVLDQLISERLVMRLGEQADYWLGSDFVGAMIDRGNALLIRMIKQKETTDRVSLTEQEIKSEYKKMLKDFRVPEQVRGKEIRFKSKAAADSTRHRLVDKQHPISFDSLAREISLGPTRYISGDMGWVTRGTQPKSVEKVLFTLAPGVISQPIRIADTNWVLIKVEERKKAHVRPLDEVRPKIERKLKLEKESRLLEAYLADLRKKYKPEILLTEENTASSLESLPPLDSGDFVIPLEGGGILSSGQILASVYFGFDKSALTDEAKTTLDSLVNVLKLHPEAELIVTGCTDKSGKPDYNRKLALRRAESVVSYLTAAGIDSMRLETRTQVATEAVTAGKFKHDRRVDLIVK